MSKIIYKVVRHDGGWAYEANGTFSERFPSRQAAHQAAVRVAAEQEAPGETSYISWEDDKGHWHEEVADGKDRPQVSVED